MTIEVINASHMSLANHHRMMVLHEANHAFDRRRVGLVAPSALHAERLIDLLIGYIKPKQGVIRRRGRISWPIGRVAQLRSVLTGSQTLHVFADLYGLDARDTLSHVERLMDLTDLMNKPVARWPRDKVLELAYTTALLPQFDVYIVEGSLNASDEAFMERWGEVFAARLEKAQLIYYTSSPAYMARYATSAVALKNGKLIAYSDLNDAFAAQTVSDEGADEWERDSPSEEEEL